MAKTVVTIRCRLTWWVRSYLLAASFFLRSVDSFLDMDDDRLQTFTDRQAEFIAKHGVRFVVKTDG